MRHPHCQCADPERWYTKAITCISINWEVDGYIVSTQKAAPYIYSWNSATFVDGIHTISAVANNVGGETGSASVNVTTRNGVTAKSFYFSNSTGNDANAPCTNSSSPCQTITELNSLTYHGGDIINLLAGDTWKLTSARPSLLGPSTGLGTQNAYPGGSNAPIAIQTYGDGTCNPIAGLISGCATLALSSDATTTQGLLLANLSNIVVNHVVVTGGNATALASNSGIGIYVRNTVGTNRGITIENSEILDFAIDLYGNNSNGVLFLLASANALFLWNRTSLKIGLRLSRLRENR